MARKSKVQSRALSRILRKLPDEITDDIKVGVKTTAERTLELLREGAPRGFTGETRDELKMRRRKRGLGYSVGYFRNAGTIGFGAVKARWFEFGTKKMMARPFFGPTLRRIRPEYMREQQDLVNRALRGASKL